MGRGQPQTRHKQEQGKSYVITSVSHKARVSSYITGGDPAQNLYENKFTCVPALPAPHCGPSRTPHNPGSSGPERSVLVVDLSALDYRVR